MKSKIICYIILILFSSALCNSQTMTVYDIDCSGYPLIKAKMFALDSAGNSYPNLQSSDINLTENGVNRSITYLSCPSSKSPDALSSVLTIDVSGSMYGTGNEIAKTAARAWVNMLPLGKSECAITTFNHSNFLNQDFTTDRKTLLSIIDKLPADGGTDFDQGLLLPAAGALLIAEGGKYKRVVVFLTDGYSYGNEDQIVAKANSINASIYCIVLNNAAPDVLKNISTRTGGRYFENITTENQAADVYRTILMLSQGGEPCDIEWNSDGCKTSVKAEFSIPKHSIGTEVNYEISSHFLPALELKPSQSIKFGGIPPGISATKKITVKAKNKPVTIESITVNNPLFKIKNFTGPVTLQVNDTILVTLEFTPKDSNYTLGRIELKSNSCTGSILYASAGYPKGPLENSTLKIIEPNGSEVYQTGADTLITWDGCLPTDTVSLEYSLDNGETWTVITDTANGLIHRWNCPKNPSDLCLMKIKQIENNQSEPVSLKGHTNYVTQARWSESGKNILSVGDDRYIRIWNAENSQIVSTISSYLHFQAICWLKGQAKVASSMSDYKIKIFDTKTSAETMELTGHGMWVSSINCSNDGKWLASAGNDDFIKIWDLSNGNDTATIKIDVSTNVVEWSPNDSLLAAGCNDNTIKIFKTSDWSLVKELTGHSAAVTSLSWSSDGMRIVSGSNDKSVIVWDIESSQQLNNFKEHTGAVTSVSWQKKSETIASAGKDNQIIIWDSELGKRVGTLTGHTAAINYIEWSDNGTKLLSAAEDATIKIWSFNYVLQQDISDTVWSIVEPSFSSHDVDMKKVLLGSVKDSVMKSFISNNSKLTLKIDSIKIVGSNDFSILSGVPPFEVSPNSVHQVEFRFKPTSIGIKNANIYIFSREDTLIQKITGIAVEPSLEIVTNLVDFGKVHVDFNKDTVVALVKNISSKEVVITNMRMLGPDSSQFILSDTTLTYTLAQNETKEIKMRFAPSAKGRTSGTLGFYYSGDGSPSVANLFGEGYSNCSEDAFYFQNFDSTSTINIVGEAYKYQSYILLSPVGNNLAGGIWWKKKVNVADGFTTSFKFQLSEGNNNNSNEKSSPGADGLAFVIQNSANNSLGFAGGGMGFENISNCLAIEFDSFANDSLQLENMFDPDGHHVAIQTNETGAITSRHKAEYTLGIKSLPFDFLADSSRTYYCMIDYKIDGGKLRIFLDTVQALLKPVLEVDSLDLSRILSLDGNKKAFVGITSATGTAWENHILLNWWFCPKPETITSVYQPLEQVQNIFKTYPNPFNNEINFEFHSKNDDWLSIEITNIYGEKVYIEQNIYVHSGVNTVNIKTESLQSGVYFAKLSMNKIEQIIKIVKFN